MRAKIRIALFSLSLLSVAGIGAGTRQGVATPPHPPIPIPFNLKEAGFVTLVIEDANGRRVRNLLSETPFPAGENTAWWDGLDDVGRDPEAASHAVYHVPGQMVGAGTYSVRGLFRKRIDLRYQMAPYTSGNPPWATPEKSSEWLANHTPPQAALFLPENETALTPPGRTAGGQILIGSPITEGGSGLAWLDTKGVKEHGVGWIGGNWSGAGYLARDVGARKKPGTYAFVGSAIDNELRLTALTRDGDRPVMTPAYSLRREGSVGDVDSSDVGGIAARDNLLVATLRKADGGKLLFVDVLTGKELGTIRVKDARGVAFDPQGRLLVLSGNRLLRCTLPKTVVASEKLDPAGWTAIASVRSEAAHNAIDLDAASRWSTNDDQKPGQTFTLDTQKPHTFSRLVLTGHPADMPRGYRVTVSDDGRNWRLVATGNGPRADTMTIAFPRTTARFVRIEQTENLTKDFYGYWSINNLELLNAPGDADLATLTRPEGYGVALLRRDWTAAGDSKPDLVARALDGDYGTRWDSGASQTPGQNIVVDMKAPRVFSRVVMSSAGGDDDSPQAYEVYVSDDGQNWGRPVATGRNAGRHCVATFDKATARFLKIVQTGRSERWWGINELNVYDSTGAVAASDPRPMPEPQTLVAGLHDPQGLALDSVGHIFVSEQGSSHQVKMFDASTGKLLRSFGHAGAVADGNYDASHMNHPCGLAVDGKNQLWVAENEFRPKRVSVWNVSTGALVRALYGPPLYGGGGELDPKDETLWHTMGMTFKLDWAKRTAKPIEIHSRRAQPQTPFYVSGHRYMTDCYNSNPTNGSSAGLWRIDAKGVARAVAQVASTSDLPLFPRLDAPDDKARPFAAVVPKGANFFFWQDENGDGEKQRSEVAFRALKDGGIDGVTVMPDLSFVVTNLDGQTVRFAPKRISASGSPTYDATHGQALASGVQHPTTSGGGQAIAARDGWTILTVSPRPFAPYGMAGVKSGVPMWTYPSMWPGLHASHISPLPDHPGELIGTTRLIGGTVTPRGTGTELWAINGNMGNVYLMTTDGLFVATLFKDHRQAGWNFPKEKPDLLVNDASNGQESFWPQWTQTKDGRVFLTAGTSFIIRVDGLDSITRLPATSLRVTPAMLDSARAYFVRSEAARQAEEGAAKGPLTVALRAVAPVVDGKLDDWSDASFATIDVRSQQQGDWQRTDLRTEGAVAVSGDRLFAAFRTGDKDLLRNGGESLPLLFKSGGALDLMIGATPEGERLLVTRVKGKTTAVLYRPRVPGAATDPVAFSSPLRTLKFDRVDDVSDQVSLAEDGQGDYEISLPLQTLGLSPQAGQTLKGDIGVLRGNGFQTLQRVYWRNKASGITADVPSEAELTPQLWGGWEFKAAGFP